MIGKILELVTKLKKDEQGQSIVEFALVLPILLLIVLAIMEFGWLFNGHILVTSSAREGARVAAVSNVQEEIISAVQEHVSGTAVTVQEIKVTRPTDGEEGAISGAVVVTVTATMEPLVGFFVAGPYEITQRATMRQELRFDTGD